MWTRRWKYAVENHKPNTGHRAHSDRYHEAFLYDLQHDPYELNNLIDSRAHADVCSVMRDRLHRRMDAIYEPERKIELVERKPSGQLTVSDAETYH
ncbi:MAG: hypothetical protein AAF916_05475 [Planctomycetota bacterium]